MKKIHSSMINGNIEKNERQVHVREFIGRSGGTVLPINIFCHFGQSN